MSQDAGGCRTALDVELVEERDAGRIEICEGFPVRVPVLGDLLPAHARLEYRARHHFEVVGQRGGLDDVGNRVGHKSARLRPISPWTFGSRTSMRKSRKSGDHCYSRHSHPSEESKELSGFVYVDEMLNCVDCGRQFVFSSGEQRFYEQKGFQNKPNRCPDCRQARKQMRTRRRRRRGRRRARRRTSARDVHRDVQPVRRSGRGAVQSAWR